MKDAIKRAIRKLESFRPSTILGVVGFDGFVDEVVHVVDKRFDAERYKRIETISEYAARLAKAANVSTNIEVVTIQKKIGGNGTIFANSLLKQGLQIDYIGALGYPTINAVYEQFAKECKCFSIAEPGLTDAVEFYDGKIIRSKLDRLNQVNWGNLVNIVGLDTIRAEFQKADFFAFMNWSLLVHASEIWDGIIKDVFKAIPRRKDQKLFVDLADPEKREEADLRYALHQIGQMNDYADVILGLNKKEACEICSVLGRAYADCETINLQELMEYILKKVPVSTLVVHTAKEAFVGQPGKRIISTETPYCEKPMLTTGAGDNFNAGFMLGQMAGLDVEESLQTAVYNAGYYVRNAGSPDTKELIAFMKQDENDGA